MPNRAAPPVHRRAAETWRRADGAVEASQRRPPDEAAIGLAYNSVPYVVVMGTPADIEDLAVGFTITERIAARSDIDKVAVSQTPHGLLADVLLSPKASASLAAARRRTLESRSSCGLCGVESLRQAVRPIAMVGQGPGISRTAIHAALEALEAGRVIGRRAGATHAAAWAEANGEVRLLREDVGRHNALDKVVGAAARAGLCPDTVFILVTSRCSYEMVEKTAAAGVSVLVAMSAPTALAIERAQVSGMTLIALARANGHTVFTGHERVQAR